MIIFAIITIVLSIPSSTVGSGAHWGYIPPTGPDQWAHLDVKYAVCGAGKLQSPISIPIGHLIYLNSHISYHNMRPHVVGTLKNNGHTVEYEITSTTNFSPQFVISYPDFPESGGTYELLQFHFHWGSVDSQGSEHQLDGWSAPAEVHFVTKNTKYPTPEDAGKYADGFLVIGALLQVCDRSDFDSVFGVNNSNLNQIHYSPNEVENLHVKLGDIIHNIRRKNEFYIYWGSFTTPPCSQAVNWLVSQSSLCISRSQLEQLRSQRISNLGPALINNFRPVQPLNGRRVFTNI